MQRLSNSRSCLGKISAIPKLVCSHLSFGIYYKQQSIVFILKAFPCMEHRIIHPLMTIEQKLRWLLPADLYASVWVNPTAETLTNTFNHLRTLRHILYDYLPRQIAENPPSLGETRYMWREGTLMFTDLAGFTRLLEANAIHGRAGAETLLGVLNDYFTHMIEIVSKSGGVLLEFTGDAMLGQFTSDSMQHATTRAVRAGLRMQRAMHHFANIETDQGNLSLGMRIGLHHGRFIAADIGTPRRMEQVLLGSTVLATKLAEGNGLVGSVNLTEAAYEHVKDTFHCQPGEPGYMLVIDNLNDNQLGEYDLSPSRRRLASALLLDRSIEGLVHEIDSAINLVQPLASYIPMQILNLLVESASRRRIVPEFPELSVIFVNLIGLPESVDYAFPGEEKPPIVAISQAFALINAAVEARGGVLKNVTYHHTGSDMLIYFGVPNAHTNDSTRAAEAALVIRNIIMTFQPPKVGGKKVDVYCQIGLARGPVFAAEIGEMRGRREFNILGDTVNTAARLMSRAGRNQILLTESAYLPIADRYACVSLGLYALKGKAASLPIFSLEGYREE